MNPLEKTNIVCGKETESSICMEQMTGWAERELITVNPFDLKQHPENKRIYADSKRLVVLIESIIRVGILQPIIVNEQMEVLSGWRRVLAILAIGTFLQIEVIRVKLKPEDESAFIVYSNTHRTKTALEKYREAAVLRQHWLKKPGQRTDLQPELTEVEKKSTRSRIADAIGVSETEIFKITSIGDKDQAMLELVGDDVTLNEAYNAVKSDKPKHKVPSEEIDLDTIHPCPFCGNIPKRIEFDENNNLKYTEQ